MVQSIRLEPKDKRHYSVNIHRNALGKIISVTLVSKNRGILFIDLETKTIKKEPFLTKTNNEHLNLFCEKLFHEQLIPAVLDKSITLIKFSNRTEEKFLEQLNKYTAKEIE